MLVLVERVFVHKPRTRHVTSACLIRGFDVELGCRDVWAYPAAGVFADAQGAAPATWPCGSTSWCTRTRTASRKTRTAPGTASSTCNVTQS